MCRSFQTFRSEIVLLVKLLGRSVRLVLLGKKATHTHTRTQTNWDRLRSQLIIQLDLFSVLIVHSPCANHPVPVYSRVLSAHLAALHCCCSAVVTARLHVQPTGGARLCGWSVHRSRYAAAVAGVAAMLLPAQQPRLQSPGWGFFFWEW